MIFISNLSEVFVSDETNKVVADDNNFNTYTIYPHSLRKAKKTVNKNTICPSRYFHYHTKHTNVLWNSATEEISIRIASIEAYFGSTLKCTRVRASIKCTNTRVIIAVIFQHTHYYCGHFPTHVLLLWSFSNTRIIIAVIFQHTNYYCGHFPTHELLWSFSNTRIIIAVIF